MTSPSSAASAKRFPAWVYSARHVTFFSVQIAILLTAVFWWRHLPPPGYAVALLALAAAALSVHEGTSAWQKALWMLTIGAMLPIEFRAINKDRAAQDAAHQQQRVEQLNEFNRITSALQMSMDINQQQFANAIGRTDLVLNGLTGGDSYAVIVPAIRPGLKEIPLVIENRGTYILTGVSVTVYAVGVWIGMTHDSIMQSVANRVGVGTLHPGERLVLNARLIPEQMMQVDENGQHFGRVFIYVAGQNFTTVEYLDIAPDPPNTWKFKYMTYRLPEKRGTRPLEECLWTHDMDDPKIIKPKHPHRP
jgi:hypothetical protein